MMGRRLGAWFAVLVVAGLAALLPPATTSAHANLVRAEPSPNEVLDEAPSEVSASFSETIAPEFSSLLVLDEAGEQVDNGDTRVGADGLSMAVTLPGGLPDGTYTVVWRNVSTVDGHSRLGAFPFFVGVEPGAAPAVVIDDSPILQSPADPVVRFATLLSALVFVGAAVVQLAVWRPALAPFDLPEALTSRLGRALRRLLLASCGSLLVGSAAQLWVQADIVTGGGPFEALGRPLWTVLEATQWGHAWLWRVGLAAVALAAVWALPRLPSHLERRAELLALGCGAGVLVAFSAASHAYASIEIRTPSVAADVLHLLAASAWAGGLAALLVGIIVVRRALGPDEARRVLAAASARFSLLAAVSVLVLVVTGLYSAWAEVAVVRALDTPYGRTLLTKVALVAGLLAIGALNLLWARPALQRRTGAASRLARLVGVEVTLVALVVLATGFLTSMEPGRAAQSREDARAGITFEGGDSVTTIKARMEPGTLGDNELRVEVSDRNGQPVTDARVAVRVRYVDRDLGAIDLTAEPAGDGLYVADDLAITLAGEWQAEVSVERPGAFDARATSRFALGGLDAGASSLLTTERQAWQWAVAGLAVIGIGLLGVGLLARRDRRLPGRLVTNGGGAALLVAVVAFTVMPGDERNVSTEVNPIPPDAASIDLGRALYLDNCVTCHGEGAQGDGPLAASLDPPPADLTLHVPLHPDADIFEFIAHGIEGTTMPAFSGDFSDDQIWHLLNYLRSLPQRDN